MVVGVGKALLPKFFTFGAPTMISKHTIARITEEARVEDVVGEFVTLKKRGANLLGLCPFHNEKTPSFNVNPARNIYKCFGCGKAGGPLNFLMDYQQLTYPDALRYLAKKYNIEIEEDRQNEEERREEIEKHNLTESILIANGAAQKYFTDYMLNNEHGRIGLAYFKERGFTKQTIEKFQLGFSPEGGDVFTKYALQNGFQLDVLKKAGLTSPKEGSTYDFFRNRVMFPIHSMVGKVLGFGGRIMVKDEKAPKYVNTPESEVYQKSKILYGAYFAKNEIRKKDECLMVEGYTDVISLHQAGIENAVASSGTSLTVEQIRLIRRITPNITMLYDGDAAGIKAALRGTDLILEEGMNVRVVILPSPEDPDSYVRKVGAEAFEQFIRDNRKDLIVFKTSLFAKEAQNDPIRKAELIKDIIDSIGKIPEPIQRSVYIKECAQLFDMSEQLLITEVNKLRRKKATEKDTSQPVDRPVNEETEATTQLPQEERVATPPTTLPVLERDVIRLLLDFGTWTINLGEENVSVAHYIFEELDGQQIETPGLKEVFEYIKCEYQEGNVHDDKFYVNHDDPKIAAVAIQLLTIPYSVSDNWWNKYKIVVPEKRHYFVKDIQSAIVRFKQFISLRELKKVDQLIREAEAQKKEEEVMRLLKLKIALQRQTIEFAQILGNVIYRPTT